MIAKIKHVAIVLVLVIATGNATMAGHPDEDHYTSHAIEKLERYGIGLTWLQIKSLTRNEAVRKLRKGHPRKTEGEEHTRFQAVLHEHGQGLTIIKIVDTPIYEAKISTSCKVSLLTDNTYTKYNVDFRLKSNPPKDAIARAKFVQEELEGSTFRAVLQEAQGKYARQLVFEGKEATKKSFDKDFRLKQIDGIELKPMIRLGEDDCRIHVIVAGQGVVGEVIVTSEAETQQMRALLPNYTVHVWAN